MDVSDAMTEHANRCTVCEPPYNVVCETGANLLKLDAALSADSIAEQIEARNNEIDIETAAQNIRCTQCGRLADATSTLPTGELVAALCMVCAGTGSEATYVAAVRKIPGFFTAQEEIDEARRIAIAATRDFINGGGKTTAAGRAMAKSFGYGDDDEIEGIVLEDSPEPLPANIGALLGGGRKGRR